MIKNLQAALPELGKIKTGFKGEEITSKQGNKFRPPKKLDHFIITSMARDENGDLMPDTELMDVLKKSDKARTNKDGNLVGLPIRLLYNDIQLNFPNRLACYVGGKTVCSGDAESAQTRDGRTIKCPCEKIEFGYTGKDKCKYNAKLYCVIEGTTSIGACHVLRTTSFNTVQSIIGGLSFIQAAAGGMLAFLPLQLVLVPKTTITPDGAPVTVYISSIVYNGSIEDLRQKALGMAQDRAKYLIEMEHVEESAKQLMATVVESDEEQQEVQEEFYPDAVDLPVADVDEKPKTETKTEPGEKVVEEKPVEEKKEPEPENKVEPKPEPEPEKPKEASPSPTEPTPITDEQKRLIVKLKKQLKVTDKSEWESWIKETVPGVTSAVDFTTEEADKFIELLKKKGDVPF